jgi:hypothetical protein
MEFLCGPEKSEQATYLLSRHWAISTTAVLKSREAKATQCRSFIRQQMNTCNSWRIDKQTNKYFFNFPHTCGETENSRSTSTPGSVHQSTNFRGKNPSIEKKHGKQKNATIPVTNTENILRRWMSFIEWFSFSPSRTRRAYVQITKKKRNHRSRRCITGADKFVFD